MCAAARVRVVGGGLVGQNWQVSGKREKESKSISEILSLASVCPLIDWSWSEILSGFDMYTSKCVRPPGESGGLVGRLAQARSTLEGFLRSLRSFLPTTIGFFLVNSPCYCYCQSLERRCAAAGWEWRVVGGRLEQAGSGWGKARSTLEGLEAHALSRVTEPPLAGLSLLSQAKRWELSEWRKGPIRNSVWAVALAKLSCMKYDQFFI